MSPFKVEQKLPPGPELPLLTQLCHSTTRCDVQRRSSPPERFIDFVGDVAPREANVVQAPFGPSGKFLTVLVALPPDVQGLAYVGPNSWNMMICHHLVRVHGHS
jgi:hypothetical protein